MWWAVDSVAPISAATLANVRGWYRGGPTPLLWGRYLNGVFAVHRPELAFARAHGIAVYFIVPDSNCSQCSGADLCGNDHTAAQAVADARDAVQAALRLHLPRRVTLYKDIEQVGACLGELSADYLLAWWHYVRHTRYVPAFYGNTSEQSYDFPRAFCAAVRAEPRFGRIVTLAQDEPEPQINKPRGAIGPANAPRYAPYRPNCVPLRKVDIWQYGESGYAEDATDADEIRPGTHGMLTPRGTVT